MIDFAKRNTLLYFRDRTAVFFSLLSVIILIALYLLFLGNVTASNLPNSPAKETLIETWFLAGILATTSMTTTLAAYAISVEDRASERSMDFFSTPIARYKIFSGYLWSAVFVGFTMTSAVFAFSLIYLSFSSHFQTSFLFILKMLGLILLSVLSSATLIVFVTGFLKTANAFAAVSTVFGTLIGFLAGIYIPIGALPSAIQTVVKLFPLSHTTALFRQSLMEQPLAEAFHGARSDSLQAFKLQMGINYEVNDLLIQNSWSISYVLLLIVLFYSLSLFFLKKNTRF